MVVPGRGDYRESMQHLLQLEELERVRHFRQHLQQPSKWFKWARYSQRVPVLGNQPSSIVQNHVVNQPNNRKNRADGQVHDESDRLSDLFSPFFSSKLLFNKFIRLDYD